MVAKDEVMKFYCDKDKTTVFGDLKVGNNLKTLSSNVLGSLTVNGNIIDSNLQDQIANMQLTPGPTGAAGEPSPQGLVGATGPVGAQGATGPPGAQGAPGAAGGSGPPGTQGDVGATGAQGNVGARGTQGARGAQGPQGDVGVQGAAAPSTVPIFFRHAHRTNY